MAVEYIRQVSNQQVIFHKNPEPSLGTSIRALDEHAEPQTFENRMLTPRSIKPGWPKPQEGSFGKSAFSAMIRSGGSTPRLATQAKSELAPNRWPAIARST